MKEATNNYDLRHPGKVPLCKRRSIEARRQGLSLTTSWEIHLYLKRWYDASTRTAPATGALVCVHSAHNCHNIHRQQTWATSSTIPHSSRLCTAYKAYRHRESDSSFQPISFARVPSYCYDLARHFSVLPLPTIEMCSVQFWKSRRCRHRWVTIKKPCTDGRNFSNCPSFQDGRARTPRSPGRWAPPGCCPVHDKKGDYDFDTIRVIDTVTRGVRLGAGPSRKDPGVDVLCCNIM